MKASRFTQISHLAGVALMLCLLWVCPATSWAQQSAVTSGTDSSATVQADTVSAATSTSRLNRHERTKVQIPADKKGKKSKKQQTEKATMLVVDQSGDTIAFTSRDSIGDLKGVEIISLTDTISAPNLGKIRVFNPDPKRALWLSALFPGLGQIYNRRYWKLPIVVGAFVGLSYGMSWNNRMLNDYTKGYRDAMDNDPGTNSYMNFYPPTVKESDLDMDWLKKALKNKKDYYRRYRDICIIGMIGVYAITIIDAYVDASLAHFDVSPDLSMRVKPAVLESNFKFKPGVGLQCSIDF